jgi:hypothetical protein
VNHLKAGKKITPSDLRAQAHNLIDSGRMASRGEVLKAISEARRKYVPQILAARELEASIVAFENWQGNYKRIVIVAGEKVELCIRTANTVAGLTLYGRPAIISLVKSKQ